ncbi:MAG TPA: carboxypeptidase-like regulatory domain-containing protein [Gemmatimonas sp.]|nr:carboxypeptidase-like regulatory domain-containing protein [Gemmatimonas sp.]
MRTLVCTISKIAAAATVITTAACGADGSARESRTEVPAQRTGIANGPGAARDGAGSGTLARAAGGADGQQYSTRVLATGTVTGKVSSGRGAPGDTSVTPTHDRIACRPFTEPTFVSSGAANGVGNAVVWLEGVAAGRANDLPRRTTLTMRGCRLEPRVQRIAAGGTLIVNSQDAVMARFRFSDTGTSDSVRAFVSTNGAGQVVPVSGATKSAGLVAISDDHHPWVRGYLAVAPHPFVVISEADGRFAMDGVPVGTYELLVWHERFGTTRQKVTVGEGREASVEIVLR